jgi:hypothetical protein
MLVWLLMVQRLQFYILIALRIFNMLSLLLLVVVLCILWMLVLVIGGRVVEVVIVRWGCDASGWD